METVDEIKPRNEKDHEIMDAAILGALKSLMKTNKKAKEAYRGALSVYETRGEADPYFRGVSQFYPVREEINALRSNLNREAA